jgi:putative flippase GtrA
MRSTKREFVSFVFWGAVNSLTSYLVYAVLLRVLPYLAAYSIAYLTGILLSYFLNSRFVFKQELQLRKALKYPLVYVVQYVLGAASLYLLVHFLNMNKLLAPLVVMAMLVPITFLLSRTILKANA